MYNYYHYKPFINNNFPQLNYMQRMNPCINYYRPHIQGAEFINMSPRQYDHSFKYLHYPTKSGFVQLKDYGPEPFVIDIEEATEQNNNYRTALWTGDYLQITLMSIDVGDDIGLEMHPDVDQFIRIEKGQGIVQMGDSRDSLDFQENVHEDFIFVIPAGKWHNLINTGNTPLKLYSIYAPPQHPHSTIHESKEAAKAAEGH